MVFTLILLFLVSMGLVALAFGIAAHPDWVAKGQDAAGKGMAAGCIAILLVCLAAVLAIVDAVLAYRWAAHLHLGFRLIGWLPLIALVLMGVGAVVMTQLSRLNEEDARREQELAIPVFLLVEQSDARLSRLFNAIQSRYPTVQTQLFTHPAALHWQQHWLPRAKLIAIQADLPMTEKDLPEDTTRGLIDDILYMNAGVPVLLHTADPSAADALADKLRTGGATVRVVSSAAADWIDAVWLPAALDLLKTFPPPVPESTDPA